MARRKKKASAQTQEEFPVDSVMHWANQAYVAKERFLRIACRWSARRCEALTTFAMSLSRHHLEDRSVLWRLLKVLREVPAYQAANVKATEARRAVEREAAANRKALSAVAKQHPKGHLIGATQTVGYKSPGHKKHWGTRRKRRG